MAGTNVGAVYIDLELNADEFKKGLGGIGKYASDLEVMFGRMQEGIAAFFSVDGFVPMLQGFEGLMGGINPVHGGLARLQEAVGWLTARAVEFDGSVLRLSGSLEDMPFTYLEGSVYDFGDAIDGLDEKSQMFGENWHEMMLAARDDAEDAGKGFSEIFGVEIPSAWSDMLGGMRDGWSEAWTGMKQAFNGIINRIIGGINNMISGLNNFRVDIPSWMGGGSFGFNIPKIPEVPALAKGGIVAAPTLALVGERGREAVLPLDNNTGWMADLANVLAEAVAANQAYGRNQGESKVNLYLDGRKVAEGIIDDLYEEAERRDFSPIF